MYIILFYKLDFIYNFQKNIFTIRFTLDTKHFFKTINIYFAFVNNRIIVEKYNNNLTIML